VANIQEHILVIRLGALGDLIFCLQAFHEIRQAHPHAKIALLTRAPFAAFAEKMPYFDSIIIDTHPTFTRPLAWVKLLKAIRGFVPTRVYDLQGKPRQSVLYTLLGGPFGPPWSGAAPFCKFPRLWPPSPDMSFPAFLGTQLRLADVPSSTPVSLDWLTAGVEKFALPSSYVVLVPGCSPEASYKRWPASHYAMLAHKFHEHKIACVVVGGPDDRGAAAEIKATAPYAIDLCGQTNLFELAAVLRKAEGVIGNDTGPLHMAASVGATTLALFSGRSNPVWSKPPGPRSAVIQSPLLSDLSADKVFTAFNILLKHTEGKGT